jgi:nucleotide-binding universal stress UspA family protein
MKIHKMLIAIDDSKYAEHAAAYGFELANLYKAHVGLVNIVEPVIPPPSGTDLMTGSIFESQLSTDPEIINIQKEASENMIQRTIKNFAGDLQVSSFTNYGPTADGIITCSNEFNADLIVIGTHTRTGIDRLLMGSVAEHVVRHSLVPVLVVPFKEDN